MLSLASTKWVTIRNDGKIFLQKIKPWNQYFNLRQHWVIYLFIFSEFCLEKKRFLKRKKIINLMFKSSARVNLKTSLWLLPTCLSLSLCTSLSFSANHLELGQYVYWSRTKAYQKDNNIFLWFTDLFMFLKKMKLFKVFQLYLTSLPPPLRYTGKISVYWMFYFIFQKDFDPIYPVDTNGI